MNGRSLLSRFRGLTRDDKELYLVILVVYIWLLMAIPDTWFGNIPHKLYALEQMIWFIVFLLTIDITYCYHEYGLILDLRRDFNFYASMGIIVVIVGFFVMLIWFW